MRTILLASAFIVPLTLQAQQATTKADSALILKVLEAEDARDSTAPGLREGLRSENPAVRAIAVRARARITDSTYAARSEAAAPPPVKRWELPAWRTRMAAVTGNRNDCAAILSGLRDSTWHVRLRAADLVPVTCNADTAIVETLLRWTDPTEAPVVRRPAGRVSWQRLAHGMTALARLAPDSARTRLPHAEGNREWEVRMYAARAAGTLADTAALRRLAGDDDDNVKEAAIVALRRLTGHDDDSLYLHALRDKEAQSVRAAAIALRGSTNPLAPAALETALRTWKGRKSDSERDTRLALLAALGRPKSEDSPRLSRRPVPRQAVGLALGDDVRLLVTMSEHTGGGAFIIRLRGDVAPITAARIAALAREGYYDGTSWHRVEPEFVIQGGSHGHSEYVGYDRFFRDELGTLSHQRGAVGMSTRGHDTGDAQWFIDLGDNARLDGDYTVFGEVIEGMSAVDGVMEGDIIESIRVLGE